MKNQFIRFTLYAIIIYLTCGTFNPAIAVTRPFGGNGTHFCGVIDGQLNKQHSDQFPNRHYARTSAANLNVGEPRTVRMIYFLPNDRPYRAEVVQKMKDEILNIQTFYAEQMEAHGYGKITFRVESDVQSEPMVHRVDGGHPDSHYLDDTASTVLDEVQEAFDLYANVYLTVIDNSIYGIGIGDGRQSAGVGGRRGKNGGFALVGDGFHFTTAAHELGHAFGLSHDFRDGAYIMSYGPGESRLSACAAEFLSVQPYFNPDTPIEEEELPTIKLISPGTYSPGTTSVPVRVQVSDSDGLHQVLLFVTIDNPRFAIRGLELKACHGLGGEKDTIVEFDYDGVIPSDNFTNLLDAVAHPIYVHAVNTDGDVEYAFFRLVEISPYHIATLEGHTDRVDSVTYSPDGKTLASGASDGTIRLWHTAAKQDITTLTHGWFGLSVAFLSDGATLASGALDGTVKLWDVATEQEIATLEAHGGRGLSVAFLSDEATLALGSFSGTVKLWDVATEQEIATLEAHTSEVRSMSVSSDRGILASGALDGMVKLWDAAKRQEIATLTHGGWVESLSFSRDGSTLASGSTDGTVKLWDVAARQYIATLTHGDLVKSISFSHDGSTLASGSPGGTVKLWDITTLIDFATLEHADKVVSMAFSPDGTTLASGTETGTVELWDVSGLMETRSELVAEINFPDPNLRTAIARALKMSPSTPIFRPHLRALIHLEARNANISDLTGLEAATNLKILDLGVEVVGAANLSVNSNSVSDISPLRGLTKLRRLKLNSNSVSDISPVSGLTQLTDLGLGSNTISDISPVSSLTQLTDLTLSSNNISDISAVEELINLKGLFLWDNAISDISAVADLTNLRWLFVYRNNISDISPLVANTSWGNGVTVSIGGNPLSYPSIYTHIPILQERGVEIFFDKQAHPALLKISGDNQKGASFAALSQPFVVEAQDANGSVLAGILVTFAVTKGGGTLSTTITRTDPNGRAQTTLTLGPNLGRNTVQVSAAGIEVPATFHAVSDMEAPPTIADVNNDGSVNVLDLVLIASNLGQSGQNAADVNGDRVVSILDLVLAAGMFEETAAAPSAQPQAPETLTAVEVQGWLTDARALEDKNPIMKRGFLVLEQLLVSLTPTETELLANYPNPFNPETWIPYRLVEDAFVTLTIYDGSGRVVRTLNVGHRIAAVYEIQSKAIYWDGRNDVGEGVASGVYFYHLTAGDYSATRKMAILK